MRCLGEIQGRKPAENFVAFLLTEGVSTQIECTDEVADRWELWVRDEDRLDVARSEFQAFLANPHAPKYAASLKRASEILAEKEKSRQEAAKNIRHLSRAQRSAMGGKIPPLTLTLAIICVVLGFLTNFGSPGPTNSWGQAVMRNLQFVDLATWAAGGSPAASILKGEVWRVVTPIFLHHGPIHIVFNVFMLVSFGRMVERWIGTPKYALLILLLAVLPNLLQGLAPAALTGSPNFVGISGVVYGLFGYVWIRSTLNPMLGVVIPFPIVAVMVGIIVLGIAGVFPSLHLAHLCHLGGLLVGCAFGYVSEQK